MTCYIKNRLTFITESNHEITDHDIVLDSIFDDKSTITITGKHAAAKGDIVCVDNTWMGVIDGVNVDDGLTVLTCKEMSSLFDRKISENEHAITTAAGGIENTLKTALQTCFLNQADAAYQLPYLVFSTPTYTAADPMIIPDVSSGLYSIKEYMERLRRLAGVFVSYSITKISGSEKLKITIQQRTPPTRVLDFSGDFEVTAEKYNDDALAKITVNDGTGTDVDYYLKTDGTIVTSPPAAEDRAEGQWTALYATSDIDSKVADKFADKQYSHSVEFNGAEEYDFFDRAAVRKDGRVFTSYISSKRIKQGSNRFFYKIGELVTELPSLIRRLQKDA